MAELFANAVQQVSQLHKTDDDLIDRLNHRFTVVLLVTFTVLVSAKQFIGEPISCWSPSQFSAPQIAYTNSICWLKGTYYLETDRRIIPHRTQNSEFRIAYYQFVPYMLLFMATLFYLPHMLWRNVSRHMGFDLRSIIQDIKLLKPAWDLRDAIKNAKETNTEDVKIESVKKVAEKGIRQIALQIHIALEYNSLKYTIDRHKYFNRLFELFRSSRSYRLSLLYLFVKILYLINCFGQFYLLSIFLTFSFHKFGYEWLSMTLIKVQTKINNQTNESKWFPRVVMCDFMVRHLGSNQHWMAVQCNLPINLFNELIFLIIWTWFIFLTSLTCASFLLCFLSIYTNFGHQFIRKYFHRNTSLPKLSEENQNEFIKDYLSWDGILVLRILAENTNDVIMPNLIGALYHLHSKPKPIKKEYHSDDQLQSSGHYMRIDGSSI